MIKVLSNCNMFESECNTLVCPVNCIGVMGAGLAKQFKTLLPSCEDIYKDFCRRSWLKINKVKRMGNFIQLSGDLKETRKYQVLYMSTKDSWNEHSELWYIESGMKEFYTKCKDLKSYQDRTYAFPKVGCGLGSLDWVIVYPIIEKVLIQLSDEFGMNFEVYN